VVSASLAILRIDVPLMPYSEINFSTVSKISIYFSLKFMVKNLTEKLIKRLFNSKLSFPKISQNFVTYIKLANLDEREISTFRMEISASTWISFKDHRWSRSGNHKTGDLE